MRPRRWVARNAVHAHNDHLTGRKGEDGQDLIEYALLVALIALVAMAAFPALGNSIQAVFSRANTCLTSTTGC
jgi:Flp pilus assembly pilin Flp